LEEAVSFSSAKPQNFAEGTEKKADRAQSKQSPDLDLVSRVLEPEVINTIQRTGINTML
jgi:hypothetical protein